MTRAAHLRHLIAERQRRASYFDAALFGEPAWDILLDLALAAAEYRRVSTTSAYIAGGAAWGTTLRCIDSLVKRGLVERRPDPGDKRRVFVALTQAGRDAMGDYLADAARRVAA